MHRIRARIVSKTNVFGTCCCVFPSKRPLYRSIHLAASRKKRARQTNRIIVNMFKQSVTLNISRCYFPFVEQQQQQQFSPTSLMPQPNQVTVAAAATQESHAAGNKLERSSLASNWRRTRGDLLSIPHCSSHVLFSCLVAVGIIFLCSKQAAGCTVLLLLLRHA